MRHLFILTRREESHRKESFICSDDSDMLKEKQAKERVGELGWECAVGTQSKI